MTLDKKAIGPDRVHPEEPSAVGSRNSLNRDGRSEYIESQRIIDEEVDRILNHVESKLPPEVLEKLTVSGSIKEILHNYFNQGFHNMYGRYLSTVEDEMSKKFQSLVDKEELKNLNRYTPQDVGELLDEIGGVEKFNNAGLEKSIVNIHSYLQNHLEYGISDLQATTNKILREKTDIGLMVGADNAYTLVKGHYSDNKIKPETVTDVSLSINISETELLNPVFHFQVGAETLIREVMSSFVLGKLDQEIDHLNKTRTESGEEPLSEAQQLIEKLKNLEQHIDFEDQSDSPQYNWVSKDFLQALEPGESPADPDSLNVLSNIKRIVDRENMRNQGFNKAVTALTQILDKTRLGYQHIENFKQARKVVIREYSEQSAIDLPDERYSATLAYHDDEQLKEMRNAYCAQLDEFDLQTKKLWDVYERVHMAQRTEQGFLDFQTVAQQYLKPEQTPDGQTATSPSAGARSHWDELFFVQPKKSDMEKLNDTFAEKRKVLSRKFQLLRTKIHDTFKFENPSNRVILDQRLDFLEDQFETFNRQVNPYHLRAGLSLEVSLTTIKRKENTMNSVSNVISEFLDSVSTGFSDNSNQLETPELTYSPSFEASPGVTA